MTTTPSPPDRGANEPVGPRPPFSRVQGLLVALAVAAALVAGGWWIWSAPRLVIEPGAVDFGTVAPGASTAAPVVRTLQLRNEGRRAAHVQTLTFQGNTGDFAVMPGSACLAAPLAPGAQCEIQVGYQPQRTGPTSARLLAAGEGQRAADATLTGRARVGRLSIAPGTDAGGRLDFGLVDVGSLAPTQRVTVQNSGDAPLRVRPARGVAPPFSLVDDGCAGRELAPGAICVVELNFRAALPRVADGVMTLSADGPAGSDLRVALRGQGRAGRLEVQPPHLAFGAADAGGPDVVQSIRVRNTGDAPLRLAAPWLEASGEAYQATFERSFSSDDADCRRGALAPGASCRITVRFHPLPPRGGRAARLHVATEGTEMNVTLTGQVRLGELAFEPPAPVDFGRVEGTGADAAIAGTPAQRRIRLANRGDAAVRLAAPVIDGASARDFRIDGSTCADLLGPGRRCELTLRYQPAAPGASQARIVATPAGDGVPAAAVALTGTAVARP